LYVSIPVDSAVEVTLLFRIGLSSRPLLLFDVLFGFLEADDD
jgi:hypothetical protein